MNPGELIGKALKEGRSTLNEAESKRLLAAYGVPVVDEVAAAGPEAAAEAAAGLGFPVVLKGLGARLTHKTERGLVRLNLGTPEEVRRAADGIIRAAGDDLEGLLVQPRLPGRRELVLGLFHDDQFGPVVMFGLGGVFTEALDDVAFRLAPLDRPHAAHMLEEIRSSALLGEFRGERPARRDRIEEALVGLSRLALEQPEVREVDVNPLLVGPDGEVTAVDALVVLGPPPRPVTGRPPVDPTDVGALFYPKSVAFVGASGNFRKWGHLIFTNVVAGGFEGGIHLVNAKAPRIAGRPVYKAVTDIPGPVDLAVVTVPAGQVLGLLPEFERKGIKRVILITSGFAETGPEGRELEERLVAEARARGLLIMGPNTMGILNSYHKFYCLGSHVRPKPGSTAFVSQSGNMGVQLLSFAEEQGIGIRGFGGTGNEAMVTIEDALDSFAVDRLTNTVLLYVESVKHGRRFFESARKVSLKKPIVVLKGGRTKAGHKAAASHTGALASNVRVFDAACRQAGVILADQPMDLLDLSAAFSSLPLPRNRRVAIMTLGGGWGVVTADLCNRYGLEVPELDPDLITRMDQLLPPFWSRSNPVDLVGETDPTVPVKVMDLLLGWNGCDAVINLGIKGRRLGLQKLIESSRLADPDQDPAALEDLRQAMTQFEQDYVVHLVRLMERHHKPILGVSLATGGAEETVIDVKDSKYKGVFFSTPERAVKALSEMCEYNGWLDREGVPQGERGI
ncbi:MAG: acetate--CoA ligase family protein [Thermodesulfobacteriota bacterium]